MLGTTPYNIRKVDGKFYVSFYISQIGFTAEYNTDKNMLRNVYFSSVFVNPTTNLTIQHFELLLEASNKDKINQFILDPLLYIKNINSKAYTNYLKHR